MRAEIQFKFIEKDIRRAQHLEKLLGERGHLSFADIEVINSTFTETLTSVLDRLEQFRAGLAPSLVMIDPFGFSDTPMELIGRILRNDKAEVYISFMYSFINRFDEHPKLESSFDSLYGTKEWRQLAKIPDPEERKVALYGLYERRLRESGAKYVLHFELYEGQRLEYAIFFGTGNLRGCDEMKKAIWKVAPMGDFRYTGGTENQLALGGGLVDSNRLQDEIRQRYLGVERVTIDAVREFITSDETGFHSGHLLDHALIPMAASGELQATRIDGRKALKQFPKGTVLRFGEAQGSQASMNL